MKMSLMMFIDDEFGKTSPEQKDILKKIYKKNETMISLVDSLLKVASLGGNKNLQERNSVYVEDIIQPVVNNYQEEMKMKGINFEFEKPRENLPKITADDKKMKLVFQNLFDNAIKYTPMGGKIKAVLSQKGKEIEFQLQDSGIGIPENQKDRMFNEFFRGRNAARTGVEGSGLGLFIAKSVVESHGGKIWFESEENKGTTFHVILPIN
jgi:signal transduction histidine kinase